MELNWLQSLALGLFSGLTDILPVSSQAHQTLLMTFFGGGSADPVLRLVIRGAIFLTLLVSCWGQISRIRRQLRLTRLPKRRRIRTPDMAAVMDAKILRTALWPILLGVLLYQPASGLGSSLLWVAAASLANAVIVYLPALFPWADKDSRLVTPGESLLMGLGAGAGVLPGISSVGASYAVGVLHGVDRGYMLHLTLLMHLLYTLGLVVQDALAVISLGAMAAGSVICWCAGGAAAVAGTLLGLRLLRAAAARHGLTRFGFYSFGVALFTFILYLVV